MSLKLVQLLGERFGFEVLQKTFKWIHKITYV